MTNTIELDIQKLLGNSGDKASSSRKRVGVYAGFPVIIDETMPADEIHFVDASGNTVAALTNIGQGNPRTIKHPALAGARTASAQ